MARRDVQVVTLWNRLFREASSVSFQASKTASSSMRVAAGRKKALTHQCIKTIKIESMNYWKK